MASSARSSGLALSRRALSSAMVSSLAAAYAQVRARRSTATKVLTKMLEASRHMAVSASSVRSRSDGGWTATPDRDTSRSQLPESDDNRARPVYSRANDRKRRREERNRLEADLRLTACGH